MARSRTMRVTLAAAIVLTAVLAAVVALTADPGAAQDGRGDEATLIQVLGVAVDGDGVVTADLAVPGDLADPAVVADNFGVTVADRQVDIIEVGSLTNAVDVVIAVDTSGSMDGTKLTEAKRAATAFVDALPTDGRVAVIGFGETIEVLVEPTTDRAAARGGIEALTAGGETRLWDGLSEAARLAESADGTSLPYVVLLSDGVDSISDTSRNQAIEVVEQSQAGLYAVAITDGDPNDDLQQAVASVDGIFAADGDGTNLTDLYQRIAERLAARYRLTFAVDPDAGGTGGNSPVIFSAAVDNGSGAPSVATASTTLGPDSGRGAAAGAADPQSDAGDGTGSDGGASGGVGGDADDARGAESRLSDEAAAGDQTQLQTLPVADPGLFGRSIMLPLGALAFFAALLIVGLLVLNPATDIRLEAAAGADRAAGIGQRMTAVADRIVAMGDTDGELDRALDAAGLNLRPGEFTLISAVAVTVAGLFGWLLGGLMMAIMLAVLAVVAAPTLLNMRAGRQRRRFADQMTDTISILTGTLKSGRGLPQALEQVADQAPSPTSDQFRRIVFETNVGRDLALSMTDVAARMRSKEFLWLARAFEINREFGGDLTEILTNIADTIRDRRRVDRTVKALSAEGRASGWVMLALPILVFLFMLARTPDNVTLMFTTGLGRILLAVAIGGMVVGALWIRRLVDLKY